MSSFSASALAASSAAAVHSAVSPNCPAVSPSAAASSAQPSRLRAQATRAVYIFTPATFSELTSGKTDGHDCDMVCIHGEDSPITVTEEHCTGLASLKKVKQVYFFRVKFGSSACLRPLVERSIAPMIYQCKCPKGLFAPISDSNSARFEAYDCRLDSEEEASLRKSPDVVGGTDKNFRLQDVQVLRRN
jgi:hypothetical protein